MKKLVRSISILAIVLMTTISCSPENINDNDKQLQTELQGVSRGVKRPGTQGT